jgi:RNA polymerase-binding transcription factor DksA
MGAIEGIFFDLMISGSDPEPVYRGKARLAVAKKVTKTIKMAQNAEKSEKIASVFKKKKGDTPKAPVQKATSIQHKTNLPEDILQIPKTYLTKAELAHFKAILIKKYRESVGDVNHIEDEAMRKSRQDAAGDLSSMPIHMADIGSDNYEQEFSLGLMDNGRQLVREIMMALRRIDDSTYGMCEGTGEPIPVPRLEACPWARYCVRYAEMIEKKRASEAANKSYSGDELSALGLEGANDLG